MSTHTYSEFYFYSLLCIYFFFSLYTSSPSCRVYFNRERPLVSRECYYRTGQHRREREPQRARLLLSISLLLLASAAAMLTPAPTYSVLLSLFLCCVLFLYSFFYFLSDDISLQSGSFHTYNRESQQRTIADAIQCCWLALLYIYRHLHSQLPIDSLIYSIPYIYIYIDSR